MKNTGRLLGEYTGDKDGKLFIAIAGIHGNEKTGLAALESVFNYLYDNRPEFKGKLIGLAGNLKAITDSKRYVDTDFNRIWKGDIIDGIRRNGVERHEFHEYDELKALLTVIESIAEEVDPANIVFVDLHNTSSAEGMFTFTFEGEDNYRIASALHIPIITGLDKALQGTAIQYMNERGFCSIAFEGGPLGFEKSISIHEAGVWLLLEATGCIERSDVPNYEQHEALMVVSAENFPKISELIYVHNIEESDQFKMNPGYVNFQCIAEGEVLGADVNGEVLSPHAGYIMMPLYQAQGDEGFFITKLVS